LILFDELHNILVASLLVLEFPNEMFNVFFKSHETILNINWFELLTILHDLEVLVVNLFCLLVVLLLIVFLQVVVKNSNLQYQIVSTSFSIL